MSTKKLIKALGLIIVVALLAAALPLQAKAATTTVTCTGTGDTALLQSAIDAATNGDTISVTGTCVLDSNITVSKAVTLDGNNKAAKIQVSGTGYRITMTTAGATLQNFEIEKSDKTGEQNIIWINASNITIANNKVHGQFVIGENEVSRAIVISGGHSGLLITGNEFYGLRQPAYISGVTTGTISNNLTKGTKGWVVEQGDMTFTGNTWGTGVDANVFDIAILNTVNPIYYTDVPAMSAANNNAFIEDQRGGVKLLTPVYVDASAPSCTSDCGTARAPYNKIQDGIARVIPGGTVNVAAGEYVEDITIPAGKQLNFIGEVDAEGNPLPVITGTLSASALTGKTWSIENLNFVDDGGGDSISLTNGGTLTVSNCTFDGAGRFLTGHRAIQASGSNQLTVENSTFQNGWYVSLQGLFAQLNVINSTFTNVKSGINVQGPAGNTVTIDNTDFSVIAKGATNDTYGVRFATETAGTGGNLTITNSSFVVDKNGFVAEPETYHSAIIIRAGATGTLKVKNSSILGEVVNLATPVLDATNNWWGSNAGPEPGSISENVDYDPWLRFSDLTLEDNEIDENLPVGSLVGTFTFEDADPEDEFTLALPEGIADNESFTIDGYDLKSAEIFDFETKDTYSIRVQVTDDSDAIFEKSFTITINDANDAPVIAPIADQTIPEGVEWSYQVSASDEDVPAQTLTYSLEDGEEGDVPEGAAIDPESGELTWNPSEAQGPGEYMFDVVVNDGVDITYLTINIDVEEVNVAPVLEHIDSPITIDEEETWTFDANATDADKPDNTLTFSLVGGWGGEGAVPEGVEIDPVTGVISWMPTEEQGAAVYKFRVRVCDNGTPSLCDGQNIQVNVSEVNLAPVLDPIGNKEVGEETLLTFTAAATDADLPENALTFSLAAGEHGDIPDDAEISAAGVFTWTPSEEQGPGNYIFDVCVSDGALSDCETITVSVNEVNVAPVLDPLEYESEVNELEPMSFTASASDADVPAQSLVFSLENGEDGLVPEGASIATRFDEEDGKYYGDFTWTPSETQGPGEYTFDVCVSDGALSDCETVVVTVLDINSAPVLDQIGNQTIDELQELAFTATASDSDIPAQSLSFSIDAEAPEGASIDPVTGEFSWTPTEEQGPGDYHVYVYVTDGVAMDYERITITVNEVNVAPVLDPIGPQEVDEGSELTFTASASDDDVPAQELEFSLEDAPEGAVIDPETGEFSWTPSEEQGPGVYFIVVCVTDGVDSTCETITVTVNEVNDAPVLAPIGNMDADELVELTFTATASDDDIPEQNLTFSLVDAPEGASIDPATGVFSWTPNELQGDSAFTFRVVVSDGELSDYEIITVYVNETNSAPVLDPIGPQTVDEEVELSFTANASDSDIPEQGLTFSLVGAPTGANIDGETGEFVWTPEEDQDGAHSFDVCVSDGELEDCETITVTVNEVNVAPVLDPIEDQEVNELVELAFTATASDDDDPEQELVFSLDGAPTGAVIDPETGEFSWTPSEAQGPGVYTFSVLVSDGIEYDYQFITVTVNEVNVAPVLDPIGNKIGYPEFELTFTAHATDVDFPVQTLTYSLDGAPEGAVIDPSSGVFSWTPSETGEYTFTVLVNDGLLYDFEIITVTVEGNNPPVLDPIGDKTTNELVALTFTASASDPDEGQILTFSLVDAPEGAVINALSGAFSWTPTEAQGPGEYTFDVCVSDSELEDCETITVTVNEVNVAPVLAEIGDKSIAELALLSFNATATDADIPVQTLVFSLADGDEGEVPEGAEITPAGAFSWTPSEAQGPGEYTFDVCVSDGALSDCETITVTVSELNVAPVLAPIGDKTIAELALLSFNASATDADLPAQTLVFSLADGAEGEVPEGAVITAAGAFSWTPTEAQGPGEYTFDVCVSDGVLSDCETITVTVSEVNVAPVAVDDTATTAEDTPVDILVSTLLANDTDIDGDTLSLTAVSNPSNGTVALAVGVVTFTPADNFHGEAGFDYTVSDGTLTDTGHVTITVTPVNDAPVADDQSLSTPEETALPVTLTATDVDGDPLSFEVTVQPLHGTLSGTAPSLTYTPALNYNGSDSFTFSVSDGHDGTDTGVISITVTPVNDAPVAVNDAYETDEDTLLTVAAPGVLSNDTDVDGDTLTAVLVADVAHGTLALAADGSFTYLPDADWFGVDTFTYQAYDGEDYSEVVTVTITVHDVVDNTPPVAVTDEYTMDEDTTLVVDAPGILENDTDPENDVLEAELVDDVSTGTLVLNSDGSFTYTPVKNFYGTVTFTYRAFDGEFYSEPVTVTITVNNMADAIWLVIILK